MKIFRYILSVTLLCAALVISPKITANAESGAYSGEITLAYHNGSGFVIHKLDNMMNTGESAVTYQGYIPFTLRFTQEIGKVYNGYVIYRVQYDVLGNQNVGLTPSVRLLTDSPLDNIDVAVSLYSRTATSVTLDYIFYFNEYVALYDSTIVLPMSVEFMSSRLGLDADMVYSYVLAPQQDVTATSNLYQYDSIADSPGSAGDISSQLQQIIASQNQQLTQQQQQAQAQKETNNLIENLTNGYDATVADETAKHFGDSVRRYNEEEQKITDTALENLNKWTMPSEGVLSYVVNFQESFMVVSSMLQSIYDSSGNFKVLISIVFTLTVAAMVTGLFKYFKE